MLDHQTPIFLQAYGADVIFDNNNGVLHVCTKDSTKQKNTPIKFPADAKFDSNGTLIGRDGNGFIYFDLPSEFNKNNISFVVDGHVVTIVNVYDADDGKSGTRALTLYVDGVNSGGGSFGYNYDGFSDAPNNENGCLSFSGNPAIIGDKQIFVQTIPTAEQQAIWQIKRITETNENGVTKTIIEYPNGSTLFNAKLAEYNTLTYKIRE